MATKTKIAIAVGAGMVLFLAMRSAKAKAQTVTSRPPTGNGVFGPDDPNPATAGATGGTVSGPLFPDPPGVKFNVIGPEAIDWEFSE